MLLAADMDSAAAATFGIYCQYGLALYVCWLK